MTPDQIRAIAEEAIKLREKDEDGELRTTDAEWAIRNIPELAEGYLRMEKALEEAKFQRDQYLPDHANNWETIQKAMNDEIEAILRGEEKET